MAKLKAVFKPDGSGSGTAGNSSQISDGASAMTLMRRDVAEKLGMKVLAKWVGSVVVGVPPRIMGTSGMDSCDLFFLVKVWRGCADVALHAGVGVGPAFALPALFTRFGITKDDVDIFELNEGKNAVCFFAFIGFALC